MRSVLIVQARMTSTRLPGKVMKCVQGRPLLSYLLERLKRCCWVDKLVVATTTNESDDIIEEFCQSEGVSVWRGDEYDVLRRYHDAAKEHEADLVIRVTSDCPFMDPKVVDKAVRLFYEHPDFTYLSNTLHRTYPRGLDLELFTFKALEEANREATTDFEREHVTPYIRYRGDQFTLANFESDQPSSVHYRWTVDEEADFELAKLMLEALYPVKPEFTLEDCLELIDKHPTWAEINSSIEQKAEDG